MAHARMARGGASGDISWEHQVLGNESHQPHHIVGKHCGAAKTTARAHCFTLPPSHPTDRTELFHAVIGHHHTLPPYRWLRARSVVAGRFVNVYSNNDWVLGLLYRLVSYSVAFVRLALALAANSRGRLPHKGLLVDRRTPPPPRISK